MTDRAIFEPTSALTMGPVLLADPFVEKVESIACRLRERGCEVLVCSTIADAVMTAKSLRPAYVMTELRFSDGLGLSLVEWMSDRFPFARTVVHTWFASVPIAVAAVRAGADDFVPKPTDEEFLINILLLGTENVPGDCRIEKPNRVRQEHIEQVMEFSSSNVSLAARKLQLNRRSLQRMLKRYASDV